MVNLEDMVKKHAGALGFDIVGIASAEPFLRDEQAAVDRIQQGYMDGLDWYTEERVHRANRPTELLPAARSVISLAISYHTGEHEQSDEDVTGKFARYAWGDDYHEA